MEKPARWRVGDLARLTGLTVRTLHHYEEIGLLAAAARGEGGHRLYDEASVERLYRIRVLRDLGVALAEIRRLLDDDHSVATVMQQHLARVEQELAELTRLRDRLRGLCRAPNVATADLLRTLDAMSRLERHIDAHPRRGGEAFWRPLGEELRACMEASGDPREIARRARQGIQDFTGGDAAVLEALAWMRTAAPPENLAGWDPALFAYLDRALRALEAEEDNHA